MSQKIWSDSETERLIELVKKGYFPSAAAKELERSSDSVRHKIAWLKEHGKVTNNPVAVHKPEPPNEKETKPLRKKEPKPNTYHGTVEYCMNCRSAVSNWDDHLQRMGIFGCKRPAA